MQRWISGALLIAVLTGCGFVRNSQRPSFRMEAASRRCTRSLDLTATGFVQSGVHESWSEFPAARSFSDHRLEVEWLVADRALYAHVANKTSAPMTLEGVVVHPDSRRRTVARATVGPLSELSVRLLPLGETARGPDAARDVLRLEACVKVAREECTYDFRVGADV